MHFQVLTIEGFIAKKFYNFRKVTIFSHEDEYIPRPFERFILKRVQKG
jgi:hypothetical protein